jgi:6-phosphofructokinase 1
MKSIGVLTSGGDSPGMNCAIRAVVRTAIANGVKAYGIHRGYAGLINQEIKELNASSVGNIIQRGGTILQTSRCPEWHEKETRAKAAEILRSHKIDYLIIIGGDGSFNGAHLFNQETQFPVIGIPGTIDNDISGTQYTIGFDSAVQCAVEAVDRIRDTASSHARNFIVEVMGRSSSAIAVHTGLCTGAENIVIPTKKLDIAKVAADIQRGVERGKTSSIIIVAEGQKQGLSYKVQKELLDTHNIPTRVCILGHIQRGGSPSSLDRFIASNMGYQAVHSILKNETEKVTAFTQGYVKMVPLVDCLTKRNDYEDRYLDIVSTLSI